jgi:integrase
MTRNMARQLKRLTARTVAAMKKPGRHADGGNLYLTISDSAAARKTFGQCADELIKSKRREWRSEVYAGQWRTTIDDYCRPILDKPVDAIDTQAVLGVLHPIWGRIPETASRLRGRIEAVLDYAKAHGLRSGENPAAWRGHLALILPKRQKLFRGYHAAMPYGDLPEFIAKLREAETIYALALEFLIPTAGRAGEVLGATWDEIDFDAKVWVIPASRMKAGREHRVPLSPRALAILERMAGIRTGDLVFAGQRRRRPLSGTTLAALVPGATVHGFRSAFRDWAGEETSFPREIAEQALAHATGGAVEQAYRRGDALEKRRGLMQAWAQFCEPFNTGKVVALVRGAAVGE